MNSLIEKGWPVITKTAELGTIVDFKNGKILIDAGDSEIWTSIDEIDETKTAIVRAMAILNMIERIVGQRQPITPEEIEFPSVPTAPRVERIPPKPPKYPPGVEVPPRPTMEMLRDIDSFTMKALQALDRLSEKRAEVQEKLDSLNAKQKELRNLLKELTEEQKSRASDIANHLQKTFDGTKELGWFFGKWRDTLLYIVRFIKEIKEEPPPEELLEQLLTIVKEEAPQKYEIITKRLEKIKNESTQTINEIITYFAEAPIGSIKSFYRESQLIEKIKDITRRFWEWLKGVARRIVGWLNSINDSISDMSELIEETEEIKRRL